MFLFSLVFAASKVQIQLTVLHAVFAEQSYARPRDPEHSYRPYHATGTIESLNSRVSCVKTYYTGLLMMLSCSAGANRFPGEPKGSPGAPEEPRSYAEDSEACKRWDSPNEMIKHTACSALVLGFVSSRAPWSYISVNKQQGQKNEHVGGLIFFPIEL